MYDYEKTTTADLTLPTKFCEKERPSGFRPLLALSRFHPSPTYPGSTVGGSTRHDNATAVLSFPSASIACSRSNSVILVVQPTTSACCTHSSPPCVACASRTAAMHPTSSLVVLLPALRLFGDRLHLHLILPHRLLSHGSSSAASLPHTLLHLVNFPFSIPWRRLFPTSYARVVSPDLFVLRWVHNPSISPIPTDRLPPAASPGATASSFFLLLRI